MRCGRARSLVEHREGASSSTGRSVDCDGDLSEVHGFVVGGLVYEVGDADLASSAVHASEFQFERAQSRVQGNVACSVALEHVEEFREGNASEARCLKGFPFVAIRSPFNETRPVGPIETRSSATAWAVALAISAWLVAPEAVSLQPAAVAAVAAWMSECLSEAAEMLGRVHRTTIMRWVREDRLKCVRLSRKVILFERDEINRFIREHRATGQ